MPAKPSVTIEPLSPDDLKHHPEYQGRGKDDWLVVMMHVKAGRQENWWGPYDLGDNEHMERLVAHLDQAVRDPIQFFADVKAALYAKTGERDHYYLEHLDEYRRFLKKTGLKRIPNDAALRKKLEQRIAEADEIQQAAAHRPTEG